MLLQKDFINIYCQYKFSYFNIGMLSPRKQHHILELKQACIGFLPRGPSIFIQDKNVFDIQIIVLYSCTFSLKHVKCYTEFNRVEGSHDGP